MLIGATKKRFFYFLSAFFRFVACLGFVVALVSVMIAVKPNIKWLNALLLTLAITNLITAIFNLLLCGVTANGYKSNFRIQLICFLLTLLSGGIASSTFTGVAVFTRVLPEDLKSEGVYNTKTLKNKDGKYEEETKK
jgi:hypothetical protein